MHPDRFELKRLARRAGSRDRQSAQTRVGTAFANTFFVPDRLRLLAAGLLLAACGPGHSERLGATLRPAARGWSPRVLEFAGRCWQVRGSETPIGTGPNRWSSEHDAVGVGPDGTLRLRARPVGGRWFGAEVRTPLTLEETSVALELRGPLGQLDPQVVVGVFVYRDDLSELDVEFSTWGRPGNANAQFAVAPPLAARMRRFDIDRGTTTVRLGIDWTPDEIRFDMEPDRGPRIGWTYRGDGRPRPRRHSLHLNVWLLDGAAPTDGEPIEVELRDVRVWGQGQQKTRDAGCPGVAASRRWI